MLELEDARQKILDCLPMPESEECSLASAHGRILAERLCSPVDLPGFDNSAMDGYAVRAEDLRNASAEQPVTLRLVGRIEAGRTFEGELRQGECVRLFTGSPVPAGADAVIMQEDTRAGGKAAGTVECLDAVRPWENVRLRGEDVKRGAVVGEPGDGLHAGRLGLLAATGVTRVKVGREAIVGLLATGSELLEPGATPAPGKIFESNRLVLAALANRAGGIPRTFGLVQDSLEGTRDALEMAFARCDVLVTSGGVSVGEADFVKPAFAELGGQLEFWKVAIRPGRPFAFGRLGDKFLFGLPGNPGSAFVTFLLLVWPALRKWQGARNVLPASTTARLGEAIRNEGDRRSFVRVCVDADGIVRTAGLQVSHSVHSLAQANGLIDVPAGGALEVGAMVPVMRWSWAD